MNFASDNIVGASAPVLEAIIRHNGGAMAAYGGDDITRQVRATFCDLFERDVTVFFVTTGTAANALSLSAAVPPWGLCVSHREAHVIDDECGAPEFFTQGAKLVGLPGAGSKLDAGEVAALLRRLPRSAKQMPPKALSISQATESGMVYSLREIGALGEVCRGNGLSFHMDGARFANALVGLDVSPADMTWRQGVDILSFGATKNGCLMAEAIVVFEPSLAEAMEYRCKRAGQVISKGRLVAAQLEGYFAADHWLANARWANTLARRLADGLARLPGVRLAWPTQANEVFPILPHAMESALRQAGVAFHPWTDASLAPGEAVAEGESLIRLVVSFATQEAQVDRLVEIAASAAARHAAE